MSSVPIRTITLGLADPHPLPTSSVRQAAHILQQARQRFAAEGYEVQTVRLSTRPLFDDLAGWSPTSILQYGRTLQDLLADLGLEYCSLGPAPALRPDFSLDLLDLLVDLLLIAPATSATVQLAGRLANEDVLRAEAALPTARAIQRLSQESPEGFANFRFAMLARVAPGSPFFPSAYHHASPTNDLSIGLQGASLVATAVRAHQTEPPIPLDPSLLTHWLYETLQTHNAPYESIARSFARQHSLLYTGMDYSPAPLGDDSIVAALELCGYGPFGSPGTLTCIAALTAALKKLEPSSPGYNGVMLPVLEDTLLGQRWAEKRVNVQQLLLYSAICGTGLDTIPLPGDTPAEAIAHLLLDVATLALRLAKPLSARLFPVPGKHDGDLTTFTSPYLTNTAVRGLLD